MSGFTTRPPTQRVVPLDPSKHVNYTLGMVLGDDEFKQEFAYLSGRDQWITRDLLGYGTVCGLRVAIETDSRGPQVAVAPGVAVTPRGQLVRVPSAQCALLNNWLALEKNKRELLARLGSPLGNAVPLYVVLCYRECPTDMVPIPGEPCRSEEDTMAPSRLADDFQLELRFDPPDQREEEAVRDFVAWLKQIEITDVPGPFATRQEVEEAIHAAADFLSSPLSSPPDFMFGSPPSTLRIHPDDACEYLRAAFRIWVTELRPRWLGQGQQCGTPPDEGCVLLAELNVPLVRVALTGDWKVDDIRTVVINEERRPYLLHLRVLQEWMLCGRPDRALNVGVTHTFATLFVTDPTVIRAWIHHPELLDMPTGSVTIEVDGAPLSSPPQLTRVIRPLPGANVFDLQSDVPLADGDRVLVRFHADSITEQGSAMRSLAAALDRTDYTYLDREGYVLKAYVVVRFISPSHGADDHGALLGLGDDDHLQYLLADGTRPLAGDLSAGNHKVTNLALGTNPGDAVPFQQAIKQRDPAGGDLGGAYPDPTVVGIRGRAISDAVPTTNQVLTWNGGDRWEPKLHSLNDLADVDADTPLEGHVLTRRATQWVASAIPLQPIPLFPLLPFVTITRLGDRLFELWFHLDVPGNKRAIQTLISKFEVFFKVFAEISSPDPFLSPISLVNPLPVQPIPGTRNVFQTRLAEESERLRFTFDISKIAVVDTTGRVSSILELVNFGIRFMGHDGENTVTAFVRGQKVQG